MNQPLALIKRDSDIHATLFYEEIASGRVSLAASNRTISTQISPNEGMQHLTCQGSLGGVYPRSGCQDYYSTSLRFFWCSTFLRVLTPSSNWVSDGLRMSYPDISISRRRAHLFSVPFSQEELNSLEAHQQTCPHLKPAQARPLVINSYPPLLQDGLGRYPPSQYSLWYDQNIATMTSLRSHGTVERTQAVESARHLNPISATKELCDLVNHLTLVSFTGPWEEYELENQSTERECENSNVGRRARAGHCSILIPFCICLCMK